MSTTQEFNQTQIGYNYDFLCCYQNESNYEESETMYRKDFLKAMNLDSYDDSKINYTITQIYNICKNKKEIQDILKQLLENNKELFLLQTINSSDNDEENKKEDNLEIIFTLFFSYNLFNLFHNLLRYYLDDKINESHDPIFIKRKTDLISKIIDKIKE